MDFENGVIVTIYKSKVDPILVGGACPAPKLRWATPHDLWLWNVDNHPILKNRDFQQEIFFSPERRSKGVKYAKNYCLDPLIILARD